jgi:hypothetical protein
MAVLTAVYVLATVLLVRITQRQLASSKRALEFAEATEKAKYRPYVLFDLVHGADTIVRARLVNSGVSPALDVKVTMTPELTWDENDKGISFINTGVLFLAPGRELSEPATAFPDLFKRYPKFKFSGRVTYRDQQGVTYDEPFEIDLEYVRTMSYVGEIDMARELERIREAIEKFHSNGFRPLVRTIAESDYQKK